MRTVPIKASQSSVAGRSDFGLVFIFAPVRKSMARCTVSFIDAHVPGSPIRVVSGGTGSVQVCRRFGVTVVTYRFGG